MKTEPNDPINNPGKAANGQPMDISDREYLESRGVLTGLSKREYFAAMAMQGLISSTNWQDYPISPNLIKNTCAYSVEYADMLIEALNNYQK